MNWLFWKRRPRCEHVEIVLYTRAGCHLCDEAHVLLEAERARWGFVLTTVDIDTDSALVKEYGDSVPVVSVAGKLRFRGHVNAVLLGRLLEAQCKRC